MNSVKWYISSHIRVNITLALDTTLEAFVNYNFAHYHVTIIILQSYIYYDEKENSPNKLSKKVYFYGTIDRC